MLTSIQSFFRYVGNFASLNENSNRSTNTETNSKGHAEGCVNSELVAEWVVNPDPLISAIYTATERHVAFPRDIVNLVTEYLQNHEALKSLSMFSPADWTTTFNKKVEMIQPPPEMDAFLQRINPFTGKLNAESCLCVFIPSHYQDISQNTKEEQELVNHLRIPLTPATMEELIKNLSNPENQSKFRDFLNYYDDSTKKELKKARKELLNLQAKKSYWVVITLDVIPDTRNKSYLKQKDFINEKGAKEYWQVPSIREAIICSFAHYAKTGVKIFEKKWTYSDTGGTYTRCVEQINGCQTIVGYFLETGLYVNASWFDGVDYGVSVLRKFAF